MRRMLMLCGMLLLANVAMPSPHKVKIISSGPQSDAVVSALKARINGTERYITTEDYSYDLVVSVICFDMEKYRLTGAVCSFTMFFVPPSASGIWLVIGEPSLLSGSERGQIAESIFQDFVEASTEKKIQDKATDFIVGVASYCSDPKNASACRQK